MRKILVTGGTVFVSKFVADYFSKKGNKVYVLNRNSRPQLPNVMLIEGDRNHLGDQLKEIYFDVVLDITAYTGDDVKNLVEALGKFDDYVLISSSAVYPETLPQPFTEDQKCGLNTIWGAYGTNKLEAETYLRRHVPHAYILRPPYLYGPMQNVYREPFVFECALQGRKFYIPGDGNMRLQFLHVEDLCRFIEIILEKKPEKRIYNVGNPEGVSVLQWVQQCYDIAGEALNVISVQNHPQRSYFSFYDYEYSLDVTEQLALMPDVKPLKEGLEESFRWYRDHQNDVIRKPYLSYIDSHFK